MARVTVEDCIKLVPNRFELVLIAAARSRQLSAGQGRSILVERENDRNPVVALREIAEAKITAEELHDKIISDSFRHASKEEESVEDVDMSEEDMLRQLEALESEKNELDFNVDDDDDEDASLSRDETLGGAFEDAAGGANRGEANREEESELIGKPREEENFEEGEIGDEIGKAAEDEFTPSIDASLDDSEEGTMLSDAEMDDEMIGTAIDPDETSLDDFLKEEEQGDDPEGDKSEQ